MKAVVFGGSGFLGSHAADVLTESGFDVIVFDKKRSLYLSGKQQMFIGDILDFEKVFAALREADYVYNFAGIADLDNATTKPIDTIKLNIEGTINILEACRIANVKRYIFASTIYVYSKKGGFYRCSKQSAEIYIEEFYEKYGIDFTILRYGTLYGPRADIRNSIYKYLYQAIKEKKIKITGDGEELREYIHVRDAAKLSVRILDDEFKNKHLIITGHHPIKVNQLIATIREILNDSVDISFEAVSNLNHYSITPYSFIPKIGQKLTMNCYTDIGQGLLESMHEIYGKIE